MSEQVEQEVESIQISGREIILADEPFRKVWVGANPKGGLLLQFTNGESRTIVNLSGEAADALVQLLNHAGIQQIVEL